MSGFNRVLIVQWPHMWLMADLHVSRVRTQTRLLGIALFVDPGSIPARQQCAACLVLQSYTQQLTELSVLSVQQTHTLRWVLAEFRPASAILVGRVRLTDPICADKSMRRVWLPAVLLVQEAVLATQVRMSLQEQFHRGVGGILPMNVVLGPLLQML